LVTVGPEITRAIGMPIVWVFRKVPVIFLCVCVVGMVVGVVVYRAARTDPHPVLVRWLGIGTLAFYLSAACFWAYRMVQGTWAEFCDRWSAVLDGLGG
jgi:hypothetical protein